MNDFRQQYQQQWPPVLELPSDAPKPWFVAAHDGKALDNVMRSDYGAARCQNGVYRLSGGDARRVYEADQLYGISGGTLFYIDRSYQTPAGLARIIDTAVSRRLEVRRLPTAGDR